ncbi:putative VV A18-like helicase [Tetraselmis virus 1]|uniref:Putative VV A18-like helicase n=1 Tax=Tetraselmis virus 1 TaxID=2060617 RepID=A0A2P0VN62_9VIRU|nr:putative VV A18-like helicase [Tetraselmis virus 1]AUF82352.1 putative VV A18-like helicase [Tetraselmis virus 1]
MNSKKAKLQPPESLGGDAQTFLSNRGYGILKESVSPECVTMLKKYMTVSPTVNPMLSNAPPVKFPVYLESKQKLYMPKYLGLSLYGKPGTDKIDEGEELQCSFSGTLRDTQQAPVQAFLDAAKNPEKRGGIINMACAAGKTVMAIYIAGALGRKTMVIVHKEFLLNQWIERIEQFMPDARIGKIQGPVFDVENKDIVIAMLQTLAIKNFDSDAFDGFGTVIVDECHHTSAEVFSRALHRVNFRYSLGLSATVQRKDGLSHVFQWFLGGICYKTKRPKETVEVHTKKFDSCDPRYREELFMFGNKINMAKMISNVCGFKQRTGYIANLIIDTLREREGSKVLVLSERRTHLVDLEKAINELTSDYSTGFYVGGLKKEELKASEEKTIVFGTFAMAAEGMDIPALDTLILASPKSDIEQPVGRILRVRASERTRVPRVIDIVDDFSVFSAQAAKRKRYYKKCGYTIT